MGFCSHSNAPRRPINPTTRAPPLVPSDAELLKRAFITRDPERLSSVSKTLPDNYLTAEIEFWYDLTPPKGQERDYIWCAHDGRETHWKGYVMKTEDGVRFLIGKDCGKDIFGHDFNQIARSFSVLHTRQGYLIQLGSTAAALPAAIKELRHLIAHPVLGQYQTVKARSFHPGSVNRLVKRLVKRIGLDPANYGAHSLRAGFATCSAGNGVPMTTWMQVTRHKSVQVAAGSLS